MKNSISIIIPSWNGGRFLDACINSILEQTVQPLEIVIVDNGSIDGSIEHVASIYRNLKLVFNGKNLGVAAAWNIGVQIAQGQFMGFVNQDVEAHRDWLEQIEYAFEKYSRKTIIGSKLLYPDGKTIQHAGGEFHHQTVVTSHRGQGFADDGSFDDPADVDYVTGAAFVVPWDLFGTVGSFDERFYPAYFEDVDFCVRARALGARVVYWPKAVAVHNESTSLGKGSIAFLRTYHLSRLRFVLKHFDVEDLLKGFLDKEVRRINKETLHPSELDALKWVYRHSDKVLLKAALSRCAAQKVIRTIRTTCETI